MVRIVCTRSRPGPRSITVLCVKPEQCPAGVTASRDIWGAIMTMTPDTGENIRFRLLVNGDVKGTAGLASVGVLSQTLSWVRRDTIRPRVTSATSKNGSATRSNSVSEVWTRPVENISFGSRLRSELVTKSAFRFFPR